ncbi:MAG TPA: TonB-dependent receptor [Acidobacteriaceae bacterium]|nr:TonB-dependent receptor [Acidobacteriaceae bacterium]
MAFARSASPRSTASPPVSRSADLAFPSLHPGFCACSRLLLCVLTVATPCPAARLTPSAGGTNGTRQLKNLSLEQLGNVEVTTYNRTPTELWNTPAAVYVLTSEDILRSGATSIANALRLVPGVEVGRMSSNQWAISIRGLENNFSKSVLVLVDGHSVYTPLFAGVYWDILDMPLRDIDRIEVIRGPGGTIWGPNAANGVINIITKQAAQTQGILADGLIGNQDRTIDDFQIGSASHGIGFRVFGRGFERAAEYHSDGINDDAWHQERVGFRAGRASGPDSWFLEGQSYRGDSPRILGATPYDDEISGGDLNFRWEREQDNGNGLYVQAWADRTLRTNDPIGESRNNIDLAFLQHFHLSGRHEISYGGELRWSPYHILGAIPTDTILPAESTDHLYNAFAQDEIQLRPGLKFTGGLKLEDNNYSGVDLQPSGRVLWLARPHQALWGGVTRAVTTPSDLEEGQYLHAGGPSVYIQVLGNPKFMSEDVVGYEAGYRGLFGNRLYCDISAFWNQYTHLQSFSAPFVTTSGAATDINIEYENQISGSASGLELAPRVTLTDWWRLTTGYSFLNSNFSASGATSNISSSGSVDTYEHSTAKHTVFAQSMMDLPHGIQFDQMFRFVSALPAQKVPAYETMDLHLSKSMGRDLVLEAVGQNLFQPRHLEWGTGDPNQPDVGIERAAYVQLTFRTPSKSAP